MVKVLISLELVRFAMFFPAQNIESKQLGGKLLKDKDFVMDPAE